jgi:hypothetical protein
MPFMRRNPSQHIAALVACLAILVVTPSSSSAQELDGIPERVIEAALNPKSEVIYSGIMRKQLMRMGDASAVALTGVLAGERPLQDTVDRVLLIIESSFDSPEAIANQADQQPQTALFVLAISRPATPKRGAEKAFSAVEDQAEIARVRPKS